MKKFLILFIIVLWSVHITAQVTRSARGKSQSTTYTINNNVDNVATAQRSGSTTGLSAAVFDLVGYHDDLADAISDIGASSRTLRLTDSHAVTANLTIPANVGLEFANGGMFNISSGDTVTIKGPWQAGLTQQIKTGSGVLKFDEHTTSLVTPHNFASIDSSTSGLIVGDAAVEAATSGAKTLYFPSGRYKWRSEIFSSPINIIGSSSGQEFKRMDSGQVTLDSIPNASIIVCQSTAIDSPAFNIRAGITGSDNTIQAGIKIEGLTFYQAQTDYTSPNSYAWAISDTLSGRFWDGITIRNCMFMVYKGVQLRHAERTDLFNLYLDALYAGIEGYTWNDVSRIRQIHFWDFTNTTDADTYRQSSNSSWAIYLDNVDGLLMDDVFMLQREKGIYLKEIWGAIYNLTYDKVGRPIEIYNPRSLGTDLSHLDILQGSEVAIADAVIKITGDENNTANYIHLNDVEFFQSGTYNAKDHIYISYDSLQTTLSNIVMKGGITQSGININDVMSLTANNIHFTGSWANQADGYDSLATVGIRNDAANAKFIKFSNVTFGPGTTRNHALRYMYDGYFDNVSFDLGESLIEYNPVYGVGTGGAFTSSYTDSLKRVEYDDNDDVAPFQGVRFIGGSKGAYEKNKWYSFGAVYKVISLLDVSGAVDIQNYRCISLPDMGSTEECILTVDPKVDTAPRLTVMSVLADTSGPPTAGSYGKTFNGTIEIYGQFINKNGNLLTFPTRAQENWYLSAAPTTTGAYFLPGDQYLDSSPTAGSGIGWVCTVAGSPGTWVEFGVVDIASYISTLYYEGSTTWDPGNLADGAEEVKEVTVTGAALGDYTVVAFSLDVSDLTLTAAVTATNTVTVQLVNSTGVPIDLASGTIYVRVYDR